MLQQSKTSKPGTAWQTIYSLFNYWTQVKDYGNRFGGFSDGSPSSRLAIPTQEGGISALRVHLTTKLIQGAEHGIPLIKSLDFSVDVPMEKNVGEIRQQVIDAALRRLREYYDIRNDALSQGLVSFNYTGVEGL